MAEEVKGIVIYSEWFKAISRLSDEQRGRLLLALIADAGFCPEPEMDFPTSLVFDMVIPGVHQAKEAYQRRCKANAENAKKSHQRSNRPDKQETDENPSDTTDSDGVRSEAIASDGNQSEPNGRNRIEENRIEENRIEQRDSSSLSTHTTTPRARAFRPPTVEEVGAYCAERNNGIDPVVFIDFYTAKNWMIGKNKMSDWKAAVRTWEQKRARLDHIDPRGLRKKTASEITQENAERVRARLRAQGVAI